MESLAPIGPQDGGYWCRRWAVGLKQVQICAAQRSPGVR